MNIWIVKYTGIVKPSITNVEISDVSRLPVLTAYNSINMAATNALNNTRNHFLFFMIHISWVSDGSSYR